MRREETNVHSEALDAISAVPIIENLSRLLIDRISYYLLAAESLYGPRDRSFTFLGIELTPEILPQKRAGAVVNGRTCPALERTHVYIKIRNGLELPPTYWTLAHECIHLLAPGGLPIRNIEEGLADVFADQMIEWETGKAGVVSRNAERASYNAAADDVRILLKKRPNA